MRLLAFGFCLAALFSVTESSLLDFWKTILDEVREALFLPHQENKHWELHIQEPFKYSHREILNRTFVVDLLPHHQTMDAIINIGDEDLRVTFDTGAVHSWITDPYKCNRPFSTCRKETWRKTFYYGGGNVSGVYCTDHMTIAKKKISNFKFLRVDEVKIERISDAAGFIGLRPHNKEPNFLKDLKEQGRIDNESFSLYLTPQSSKIIFGGVDRKLIKPNKDFRYVKFSKDSLNIEATNLTLTLHPEEKSFTPKAGKINLIFDSGANYIYVSKEIYYFFKTSLKFDRKKIYTRKEVDETFRSMKLVTKMSETGKADKDFDLYIRPIYFMIQRDDGKYSFGIKIDLNLKENQMIMGFASLRDYYMHFDFPQNRIGFACGVGIDYKNTLHNQTYC